LATGFVPVFTEYLSQGRAEAAQRTFRAMFTLLLVFFGALTIGLFALTYTPWGTLLAPANASPENLELYRRLLRILLIAQFIFVMGGMFTGTLNALRLFCIRRCNRCSLIAGLSFLAFLARSFLARASNRRRGARFLALWPVRCSFKFRRCIAIIFR
jgi:peptidoglycan biosynthesis protein MviN/MurJ (putative lipid II flippase)